MKQSSLAANAQSSLTPKISKNVVQKQISPVTDINSVIKNQQRSAKCLDKLIKDYHETGIELVRPLYDSQLQN